MRTRWNFQAIGSGTVLVAAVLAALIALLALGYATGWDATWRAIGVTPLKPHFFDMHAVTDHAACFAQGYNAYELNSCDPLKFNYPPIWLQLGYLGINGLDSAWLSILVAFIAFVVVATLLKGRSAFNGVLSSAAILSPSVMMGVERGNIDLVILALVGSAALVFKDAKFRRAFGASLVVLVAVFLKLYPVFCVALVAKFNRRTLFFAITLIIGSLIYFYSIFDYLPIIRANTPTSFMLSYGYKVIFLGLDHLRAEAGREALRLADTWLPIVLVFIVLALGIAAAIYFAFFREPFCIVTNGTAGTAFLFGSEISLRDVFARDKFHIPIDVPAPLYSPNPGLDEKQYREQQPYCHDFLFFSDFRFVDALVEWKFERAFDICSDGSTAELGNFFRFCVDTRAELHQQYPAHFKLCRLLQYARS